MKAAKPPILGIQNGHFYLFALLGLGCQIAKECKQKKGTDVWGCRTSNTSRNMFGQIGPPGIQVEMISPKFLLSSGCALSDHLIVAEGPLNGIKCN